MSEIARKTCTICKVAKLATGDYFYRDKQSGRLSSWCLMCRNVRAKESKRRTRGIGPPLGPYGRW